jgi:hypothetical protein
LARAPRGTVRREIKGARVALRVIDPEIQTPKYYNWFGGVQKQLPRNFVADLSYNGSAGRLLTKADGRGSRTSTCRCSRTSRFRGLAARAARSSRSGWKHSISAIG